MFRRNSAKGQKMPSKKNKRIRISVKNPTPRTGHHPFRGAAQTSFADKRTKRSRTRQAQRRTWEKDN